jgi:hypothetical protein
MDPIKVVTLIPPYLIIIDSGIFIKSATNKLLRKQNLKKNSLAVGEGYTKFFPTHLELKKKKKN